MMCESNYLSEYRQFFKEFVCNVNPNDPLPLRVSCYQLTDDDLLGQVVDCVMQYLYLLNCPQGLLTQISKLAVDEVYGLYKKEPLPSYESFKIMQTVSKTVGEICRSYLENETFSKIPPPSTGTLVTALGIKHARRKMEDRMVYIQNLNSLFSVPAPHEAEYYAIFDGHNGADAAAYAVSHLHQFLLESPHYRSNVEEAFKDAYAKTEEKVTTKDVRGGSTGLAILHEPAINRLTVSWLGDSQAMMIKAGCPVMLVNPHRPQRPDEIERIQNTGGFVVEVFGVHRVNGELGVSRAFGDKQYKPMVSAVPDVVSYHLDGTEEAIILGCDGFWDVLNPQQVCETFQFQVHHQPDRLDLLSRRLVDLAKEFGSSDNISVIAVLLKPPLEITPSPKTSSTTMETSEVEPFRTNGSLSGNRLEDDDFGPETDVDAPDDSNPFGGNSCWTRPDPLQTFPDLSGLKPSAGVRFNNEYGSLENPFSNNLHDIAEEKSVEDKLEKLNNNGIDFVTFGVKEYGTDVFGSEKFGTNGVQGDQRDQLDDQFILKSEEKSGNELDKGEVRRDLPDVVNVQDVETATPFVDNKLLEATKYPEVENSTKADLISTSKGNENEVFVLKPQEMDIFETNQTQTEVDIPIKLETLDKIEKEITESEKVNTEENPNPFDTQFDDDASPFDRATPELTEEVGRLPSEEKPVLDTVVFDSNQVQLETLKSLVQAEESANEDEPLELDDGGFPVTDFTTERLDIPQPSATEKTVPDPKPGEFDGGFGADDVEAGVDGEDSEEEWKYYTGDKNHTKDNQLSDSEILNMNSPLNPDAAEFVPVSPPTGLVDPRHQTPIKAIPQGVMDDLVACSPSWASMDEVEVPDVDTFLEGAKTRPSDVKLDPDVKPFEMPTRTDPVSNVFDMPQIEGIAPLDDAERKQETVTVAVSDILDPISKVSLPTQDLIEPLNPLTANEEPSSISNLVQLNDDVKQEEPRGLDLATDMTSSFIDPSTMSADAETEVQLNGVGDGDVPVKPLAEAVEKLSFQEDVSAIIEQGDLIPKLANQDISDEVGSLLIAGDATEEVPEASTPRSTVVEPASTPPSTPLSADVTSTPVPVPDHIVEEVAEKLSTSQVATAAAVGIAAATVAGATTAAKKSPTKPATPSKTTAKSAATKTNTPATPRNAPNKKPTPSTTPRTPVGAAAKPAPKTPIPSKTVTAAPKPPVSKPATSASAAASKPKTTSAPSKAPSTVVNVKAPSAAAAAAPKPTVKSTIPPRTAPPRPRSTPAPTSGLANGDLKTAATKKPAEPAAKKPITLANRVPLTSRPLVSKTTTSVINKSTTTTATSKSATTTTASKPATTRPTSSRPSSGALSVAAKPKASSALGKKTSPTAPAPKVNGVSKPAAVKKVVSAKAESKTEAKTATAPETSAVIPNGVTVAAE